MVVYPVLSSKFLGNKCATSISQTQYSLLKNHLFMSWFTARCHGFLGYSSKAGPVIQYALTWLRTRDKMFLSAELYMRNWFEKGMQNQDNNNRGSFRMMKNLTTDPDSRIVRIILKDR